ncbi:hypothetical protein GCM10027176_20990 [Actinoallomurus bryophytorum]|uniref:PLD phosphodiesterase domain-containing protein n=1 Tax=Actinoallomurus bryophytorum TaxID=1490222 RepID=A0A543CKM1_9ACTN|nr:hypothetical protein [Actinoallomurus bryophytorum]TQL97629.1 hypothetical protein FB559_3227 [Actinoallomurus bryophytorum]
MIITVTKDYRLRARENVIHWKAVPSEVPVVSVAVLANGTFVAAGSDGRLYTRATLSTEWQRVPVPPDENLTVQSVGALPDGDVVGVDSGSKKLCYKDDGFGAAWKINSRDRTDISLLNVAAGASGKIYGIDYDKQYVYQRDGIDGSWSLVSDNESMHSVAELPDGRLIGIDEYGQVLVLGLDKRWAPLPVGGPGGGHSTRDMTALPDGGILIVGEGGGLFHCPRLPAIGWRPMGLGMPLRAVTALPDGTFIGVDTDGYLHQNTGRTATSWQKMSYPHPLLAVTATDRLIGVGADKWVYQWDDLGAAPLMWETSRGVRSVTVLPDKSVIGVSDDYLSDPDYQLHVRTWKKNTDRPGHMWLWNPVGRDPVDVQAVTSLPDGRLVAAGTDKRLYVRDGVSGTWQEVPGGGGVTWVSALPDGSLLGVGEDQQAYVWPDFQPPTWWTRPLRDGLELRALSAGPGGTLLGVSQTGRLCLIDKTTGDWTDVSGGVELLDVTTMADGTILGVTSGVVDNLMTRASLNDPWLPVRSDSAIKAVTTMPDGSLLGIGYTDWLCTRADLDLGSYWHLVPNSGTVVSVSVLTDGTILAVGTDGKLYTRTSLVGTWQVVADTNTATGNDLMSAVAVLPDDLLRPTDGWPLPVSRRPEDWLLEFTATDVLADDGDGRPWGDGTAMARRAWTGGMPWDHGCMVTPMVGGFDTMGAIREAFEAAIAEARRQSAEGVPPGERGHVYIADWLLNGLRDLSETNSWGGRRWDVKTQPEKDQTALGLILRMMSAGIVVRIMLWMPTSAQATQLGPHAAEHWNLAAAIQDHNAQLTARWNPTTPLGVVALDLRTAYSTNSPTVASLHQKMVAVRVGSVNVGFCGGVDLAFTRRDFGSHGRTALGDWQSGSGSPPAAGGWPRQASLPPSGYPAYPYDPADKVNNEPFPEDLPGVAYGGFNRHWHDQHLKLEGPVVASLEDQFAERWIISPNERQGTSTIGRVYLFDRTSTIGQRNQVQLTAVTFNTGGQAELIPLPKTRPVDPVSGGVVQMWRTIPMYPTRVFGPFTRGEFTVMAGVAKAVAQARHLITIWDQYFWSTPLAKLLAVRLNTCPTLRLLIVLPPYGTSNPDKELGLRRTAMQALWNDLAPANRSRVLVLNMWDEASGVGVYVHDKVQTYDDALLVCGSANMNRRSLENDAELDCAVLDPPTVRGHLARLYAGLAGQAWTDFGPDWFTRYWTEFALTDNDFTWAGKWFITDPFFRPNNAIGSPTLPNGTKIPTSGDWTKPDWIFDPTCFDSDLSQPDPALPDPAMAGRLDGVTYLIERYHKGRTWPRRVPQH